MDGINFTQDSVFEKFKGNSNYPILFVPHILVAGSCWAFIYNNHATLIDLASKDDFTHIKDQLLSKGVKYIDNVFISHYHGDQDCYDSSVPLANCYDKWKNAFDMNDVHLYVPRRAPLDSYDDSRGYDAVQASFDASQITLIDNNTEVEWNSLTITVRNQSIADWDYYVQNQSEYSPGVRDLNALSAIFYIDTDENTILYTGDVIKIAHTYCISQGYFRPSYLVSAPHHGVSNSSDPQMPAILNPKIITVSNNYTAGVRWGVSCPFVRDCFSADIYESIFNKDGILIDISSRNFQVIGVTSEIGGNGTSDRRTYYVDESVSADSLQDGSQSHPFKYLRGTITRCRYLTKIILLSDIVDSISLSENNGILEIDGQGHTISGLNLGNNAYLYIHDVKSASDYSWYVSNSTLVGENVTFANTSGQQLGSFYESEIYLSNVILENSIVCQNATRCKLVINNISGDCSNKYLIPSCYSSEIYVYNNSTGKIPYINFCNIRGNTIDGSTQASKLFGGWTYLSQAAGYTDLPRPYCMVNTVRHVDYVVQFAISMTGTSGTNPTLPLELFIRRSNSASTNWTAWIEIVGLSGEDWSKNISLLQNIPARPTTAGDYNLQVNVDSSNVKTYSWASIPDVPSLPVTDGNYILKCTVIDNQPTYEWVASN